VANRDVSVPTSCQKRYGAKVEPWSSFARSARTR
jgi:hypothetical protein